MSFKATKSVTKGQGPVSLPGSALAPVFAMVALFALAGCSSTPDWANPVEWYHSATSVFDDDTPPPPPANDAAAEMAKEPTPGEGQPFPNLGDVPSRPTSVTPADERKKITDSLVADRNNAHYVDEPTPQRVAPLPGAEVTAAPRPPVSSEPAAPPQYTAQASPSPSAPPPARVAPTPAPTPAPSSSSSASAPSVPGASRSLGSLIVSPTGEIKGALPGDGSPLPNSAVDMSAMSTSGYVGPMPVAVVLFNDNATQISPEQRQGLTAVAREANARGGMIRVVGHASPAKNANSSSALINNLRAAQDRAQSVASALARLGVPSSQIQVEAATAADAAPDIASVPSGAAGMRRADIFLQ